MGLYPTIEEIRGRGKPKARGAILTDPRGATDRAFFLYPSPRWNLKAYQRRHYLSADTQTNVGPYDRWELVNYSRQLYAQVGNLNAAIKAKNSWAFGTYAWDPEFTGTNKKWGEQAQEWLKHNWYPQANVRGGVYDFKTSLRVSGQMLDIDGDDLMLMVNGGVRLPQLAFYPSTRYGSTPGQGESPDKQFVKGGKYDGAKLFDGLVLDRNNRLLAVAVRKGDDDDFTYIDALNCDLSYEPDWCDQGRGIPRTAVTLLRWMDKQDIDKFLTAGVKRASVHQLQEFTEDGEPKDPTLEDEDGNDITDTAPDVSKHQYYQELDGGEVRIYKANAGEKMEAISFENPHENTENFIKRVERECLQSVGWFYELLNLPESGRAASRLVCDLANQSVWDRQFSGTRRAHRAVNFAIAAAVESKQLPRNEEQGGLDCFMWAFGSPKEISVDAGNDQTAAQNRLRMGMTSQQIEAQKAGFRWQQIREQRKAERIAQIDDAAELVEAAKKRGYELPFTRAMDMQEMDYPNGAPQQPAAKPGASAPAKGEPDKK